MAVTVYFLVFLENGTVFTHLFYIPIVLFSAWWKRKGVILTATLVIFLLATNIALSPDISIIDNLVRSVGFLFISVFTGYLFKYRTKIEEELKIEKEKIEQTLDGMGDLVFVLDQNQKVIRINKAACDALKKKPEELLGKHCYEIVHGTKTPWHNCPAVKTIQSNQAVTEEIYDPNLGKTLLVTTSPLVDKNGKILECIHSAKDITEIKQAQEELTIAGKLFDSASDSLILHNLDGSILFFNEMAYRLRGYTKEEFQTLNVKDLQAPQTKWDLQSRIKVMREKTEGTFEVNNVRKDHTIFPVEVHSRIILSDGKKLIVSAGRDITERKKLEEALRVSETKYKALVENADDAILLSDIEGKTIYKNPAYYRQLGLTEGAEENFAEIHPEDLNIVKEKHKELLKNKYSKVEYRVKHQNGEWVYRFARAVLLHDNNGHPNAVLSVIRDVTEQKMVENKLQEDQERIALSNEKLRVVGRLTRHDARNKLSAINAYAYLIKKGVKNNPDIANKLDKMTQSVKEIERIFDFAHIYEKIGSEGLVVVDVGKGYR